jgi:hypothetical protein
VGFKVRNPSSAEVREVLHARLDKGTLIYRD